MLLIDLCRGWYAAFREAESEGEAREGRDCPHRGCNATERPRQMLSRGTGEFGKLRSYSIRSESGVYFSFDYEQPHLYSHVQVEK